MRFYLGIGIWLTLSCGSLCAAADAYLSREISVNRSLHALSSELEVTLSAKVPEIDAHLVALFDSVCLQIPDQNVADEVANLASRLRSPADIVSVLRGVDQQLVLLIHQSNKRLLPIMFSRRQCSDGLDP